MTHIFLVLFQKIVPNPYLTVSGISRFDISQGILGKISLFTQLTSKPTKVKILALTHFVALRKLLVSGVSGSSDVSA